MNNIKLNIMTVLLASAPAVLLSSESVDERWDIGETGTVTIENIVGEIEILGWDRGEIHLTGSLGDSVQELELSSSGSDLYIRVINEDERDIDDTKLKLRVPAGFNIEASAVSADIDVSGLDNEKLSASSVSGDVEIQVSSAWVSIESVSGDVGFEGSTARISAESVSGDVELGGISGDVAATTVSGDMKLVAGVMENGKFETVSGDITASGALAGNGRFSAESMSGDVTISLPASQGGQFRAQSFSGKIASDFGSVEHTAHGPGSRLKHSTGDGSAEIRVESFSGNITFRQD